VTEYKQPELLFEARAARLLSIEEIYAHQSAGLFQILQEDRRIERKPAGVHAREFGEYICMWANTAPNGGLIVVGISNSGIVDGILKVGVAHINNLEKSGDVFCPDAKYDTKRVSFDGPTGRDEIVLFRVYYNEQKVVRTSEGKVPSSDFIMGKDSVFRKRTGCESGSCRSCGSLARWT
jgi:ATP-dependent DNA helicase RecG